MKLRHIEGYDCIDDNLNIILNTKNIDIRKIFKNLWYFRFDENSETLGKGLIQNNDNKYSDLKENYNINYQIYENKSRNKQIDLKNFGESTIVETEEIDRIINDKCNSENIIILELNTFNYRYDKGYNKYVGTHSCILTEKTGNKAKIVDVWYNLYNVEIQYKELLNAITRIIILDITDIQEKKLDKKELKKCVIDETSIKEMKIFFDNLKKIDLKKEYMNLTIEMVFKSSLDKGLRKIIMNRQRFAYYLYYLSEKFNDEKIKELGECIFIISMDWMRLRSILVQTYFLNKELKVEKINKITESILEKEIKIKNEIEELIW